MTIPMARVDTTDTRIGLTASDNNCRYPARPAAKAFSRVCLHHVQRGALSPTEKYLLDGQGCGSTNDCSWKVARRYGTLPARRRKTAGFTLVELMVVILIVGILAAIAIPIMHGRVDSAKWSEACATAGTIRVAVHTYASETSVATAQALVGTDLSNANTQALLGLDSQDCEGTYFVPGDYTITSVSADSIAAITVTGGNKPDAPTGSYVLQVNGRWVKQ